VLQPPSDAAHLGGEEMIHIADYAEIHGDISLGDQGPARQRKCSDVVSMLKIDWCAMRALHEIQ
jgi:hypothetical protein